MIIGYIKDLSWIIFAQCPGEFACLTTRVVRRLQNTGEWLIAVGMDPVGCRELAEPLYRQVLYYVLHNIRWVIKQ